MMLPQIFGGNLVEARDVAPLTHGYPLAFHLAPCD